MRERSERREEREEREERREESGEEIGKERGGEEEGRAGGGGRADEGHAEEVSLSWASSSGENLPRSAASQFFDGHVRGL